MFDYCFQSIAFTTIIAAVRLIEIVCPHKKLGDNKLSVTVFYYGLYISFYVYAKWCEDVYRTEGRTIYLKIE